MENIKTLNKRGVQYAIRQITLDINGDLNKFK